MDDYTQELGSKADAAVDANDDADNDADNDADDSVVGGQLTCVPFHDASTT